MKLTLVFSPPANPTYVPLGMASLLGYIESRLPRVQVLPMDLNMEAWHYLLHDTVHGKSFWDFMGGRSGDFFDRELYLNHHRAWDMGREHFMDLHGQILAYLETGEAEAAVSHFLDHLAGRVLADSPSVIGFSVMFPDQLAFSAALAMRISRQAGLEPRKTVSKKPFRIIFGGALLSAIHVEDLLDACPFIDAVVVGEGEIPLAMYLRGMDPGSIPGLFQAGETPGPKKRKPVPPVSVESLPAPDFSRFCLEQYANPQPVLPLTFSRNCKWQKCRFCAHNLSFSRYRQKSVPSFVEGIQDLANKTGARHFYLADQYVPPSLLGKLSDELLARDLCINFHVMGRPTAGYTPELLHKAARAGCRWISWGVETGSQRLLDLIRKGTQKEDIVRVLRDSHQAGISNLAMMIFGLPTSTDQDLAQTFELIDDIYPHVSAFTASSFALFEKTDFADNMNSFGLRAIKNEVLFRIGAKSVRAYRLQFGRVTQNATIAPPSGPMEVDRWIQRRRWLGEVPFVEKLSCEHFLLHAAKNIPPHGINPVNPYPSPRHAA